MHDGDQRGNRTGNRRRKPHPPRGLGRVDYAAHSSAGQCGADRPRPSPRAHCDCGGQLRQSAEKRPKLCARAIRERDGNRCQYTGRVLRPDEGSMDHVLPRSRGGKNAWENLVWAGKDVNARKGNRLPHEAGLKLLSVPRAPKELPASATIRNAHGIPEWKLFVKE